MTSNWAPIDLNFDSVQVILLRRNIRPAWPAGLKPSWEWLVVLNRQSFAVRVVQSSALPKPGNFLCRSKRHLERTSGRQSTPIGILEQLSSEGVQRGISIWVSCPATHQDPALVKTRAAERPIITMHSCNNRQKVTDRVCASVPILSCVPGSASPSSGG